MTTHDLRQFILTDDPPVTQHDVEGEYVVKVWAWCICGEWAATGEGAEAPTLALMADGFVRGHLGVRPTAITPHQSSTVGAPDEGVPTLTASVQITPEMLAGEEG